MTGISPIWSTLNKQSLACMIGVISKISFSNSWSFSNMASKSLEVEGALEVLVVEIEVDVVAVVVGVCVVDVVLVSEIK